MEFNSHYLAQPHLGHDQLMALENSDPATGLIPESSPETNPEAKATDALNDRSLQEMTLKIDDNELRELLHLQTTTLSHEPCFLTFPCYFSSHIAPVSDYVGDLSATVEGGQLEHSSFIPAFDDLPSSGLELDASVANENACQIDWWQIFEGAEVDQDSWNAGQHMMTFPDTQPLLTEPGLPDPQCLDHSYLTTIPEEPMDDLSLSQWSSLELDWSWLLDAPHAATLSEATMAGSARLPNTTVPGDDASSLQGQPRASLEKGCLANARGVPAQGPNTVERECGHGIVNLNPTEQPPSRRRPQYYQRHYSGETHQGHISQGIDAMVYGAPPRTPIGLSRPVTIPSARKGGRKGRLLPREREARSKIRKQGACIRCRQTKGKVFRHSVAQ